MIVICTSQLVCECSIFRLAVPKDNNDLEIWLSIGFYLRRLARGRLGNIWGFPTQAASNGGGAFLLVYLVMILVVAFPCLWLRWRLVAMGK